MKDAMLLFVLWIFSATTLFSQCPLGDLILNNQDQVDYFTSQCSDQDTIFGDLAIGNFESNIKDISNFNNIKIIMGGLSFRNNDSLVSVQGLEGLTKIMGQISILNNAVLNDLSALNGVSQVEGEIYIQNNPSLQTLAGFENIKVVQGDLFISDNSVLSDMTALSSMNTLKGSITIFSNPMLASLSGLDSLSYIPGGLSVQKNDTLNSFDGLERLDSIGVYMTISSNKSLKNISALSSLKKINGDLFISENDSLSDCTGLCNLLNSSGVSGVIGIGGNIGDCLNNSVVLPICLALPTESVNYLPLKVSPNPVKTTLLIEIPANEPVLFVKMFALSGKSIPLGLLDHNRIDVSGIASGMYFLIVQTKTATFHQKIVVE